MRALYEEYLRVGKPAGLTFQQYLQVIGFKNPADDRFGMDDGVMFRAAPASDGPDLISVPSQPVQGSLRVMVLLADFDDREGTKPVAHYENLLFSKDTHATGSMRDFYDEVSQGHVDVIGEVHGWFRLPRSYSYYTNGDSGTGSYPRNAQRMAQDAVNAALASGVQFRGDLDALDQSTVTALFVVHAGIGAETRPRGPSQSDNIWSHKWWMPTVQVGPNLVVNRYLTIPHDARLGVAAHELGHLAFQWEDFYDPNYAEDGSAWDGSGDWDLMAGGSYNGDGRSPAHPIAWHKSQHGWVELEEIRGSSRLTLDPASRGKAYKLISSRYRSRQYLILENRSRSGFDSHLPGEGLLVWRVDESKEMPAPHRPALQLVQADGRHDLERVGDQNAGDSGDPFPGSTGRENLFDTGTISTSFPDGDSSRIELKNIRRNSHTGRITLDAEFDGVPVMDDPIEPPVGDEPTVVRGDSAPMALIPDNAPGGVQDTIEMAGAGRVRGVTVAIDITHTYVGDLRVELVSPSGQRAVLHNRTGGNADNLTRTFSSSDTASLANLMDAFIAGEWMLHVSDHASRDTGTLNRWALLIDVGERSRTLLEKRAPGLAIPDKDPGGVADVIQIARAGIARAVRVGVDITHTYVGDLRVELVGPNGARVLLHNMAGAGTDDLKTVWTSGSSGVLAAFVGAPVRGDWVLRVSDHLGNDTGTLNEWTLIIDLASDAETVQGAVEPGLEIPDRSAAGVASHIAINETGTAQTIAVQANITHTYIGDLRVELVAPSGERAILHDRTGGNRRNLQLDLDSAGFTPLTGLIGLPIRGNWVLRVQDLEPLDDGTLDRWALTLSYSGFAPVEPEEEVVEIVEESDSA
jgi:immune inhibitor A